MKYRYVLNVFIASSFELRMESIENGKLIGSINGTVVGDAVLVPGKYGLALLFPGYDGYVDLGYQGDTCLGNLRLCIHGWVMAFWMQPENYPYGGVMDTGYRAPQGVEVFLRWPRLVVLFRTSSTEWFAEAEIYMYEDWFHVVISWQPCYGAKLYINGKLEYTLANADTYIESEGSVDYSRFLLGKSEYFKRRFQWKLDELRIWDTAMSDEDVLALYNVDVGLN